MHSYIRPDTHVLLRLASGNLKAVEITPNTSISIGKYGAFPANLLIGRPYNLTYEIQDKDDGKAHPELRIVPAHELHADELVSGSNESRDDKPDESNGVEFDIVGEDGELLMRSNRLTIDDPSRQKLTMEEIEELKKAGTGSGKDIIAKIVASHMGIEEKTSFSLAKYTLRKSRKYLKRFTVLPLSVSLLTQVLLEREPYRILELREESLALLCSWTNVHYGGANRINRTEDGSGLIGGGRWLVVDDTGGLVVAGLAEKMGILYPTETEEDDEDEDENEGDGDKSDGDEMQGMDVDQKPLEINMRNGQEDQTANKPSETERISASNTISQHHSNGSENQPVETQELTEAPTHESATLPARPRFQHVPAMASLTNTITLLHSAAQPNLGLLKHFSYDPSSPKTSHPLYSHLKTLTWLQLLNPDLDVSYQEPPIVPATELATMKSGKRGTYYRKRRRWERVKRVVDEVRAGGFDGLVVASTMNLVSILRQTVPLLRGAGQVVIYSPSVEPLTEIMDLYSRERKSAYIQRAAERTETNEVDQGVSGDNAGLHDDDFPVNPTLLLAPMLQTARVRSYQVLPGRTHPLMTSKGGAEGYLFTATRVFPVEGRVEARGRFVKKRKVETV